MPNVDSAVSTDSDDAEGGRGLLVVAALADDWGVTPRVIGKSVWAELAVSSDEETA
jgi:hypothetical protein